jgi:hypothetical protein
LYGKAITAAKAIPPAGLSEYLKKGYFPPGIKKPEAGVFPVTETVHGQAGIRDVSLLLKFSRRLI